MLEDRKDWLCAQLGSFSLLLAQEGENVSSVNGTGPLLQHHRFRSCPTSRPHSRCELVCSPTRVVMKPLPFSCPSAICNEHQNLLSADLACNRAATAEREKTRRRTSLSRPPSKKAKRRRTSWHSFLFRATAAGFNESPHAHPECHNAESSFSILATVLLIEA